MSRVQLKAVKQAVREVLEERRYRLPRREATRPVATARRIFERMADRPRHEVIEACAKAGVKRSTAATQYQLWKTEHAKR